MCLGAKLDQHLGAKLETGTLPCEFPHQALALQFAMLSKSVSFQFTFCSVHTICIICRVTQLVASQGPLLGLLKLASSIKIQVWSTDLGFRTLFN